MRPQWIESSEVLVFGYEVTTRNSFEQVDEVNLNLNKKKKKIIF